MKTNLILLTILTTLSSFNCQSQDTFSIVAVDSITGEVGSAGASCVDLFQTNFATDHFLGDLFPGVGAINTQADYSPFNQINARGRMNLGETPSQIIQWLIANDLSSIGQPTPEVRQYGIVALVNSSPESAAHTGSSAFDYKGHITGLNYAIQGNILSGQEVLDSMQARFLREEGDLACKLMASLQGANMIGADSRCAANGTSSLFAFVKVAQPNDPFGSPSFIVSVRTHETAGIEPIDSLQTKFNLVHNCQTLNINESGPLTVKNFICYPNPVNHTLYLEPFNAQNFISDYSIIQLDGTIVLKGKIQQKTIINTSGLSPGSYIIEVKNAKGSQSKIIIIQ